MRPWRIARTLRYCWNLTSKLKWKGDIPKKAPPVRFPVRPVIKVTFKHGVGLRGARKYAKSVKQNAEENCHCGLDPRSLEIPRQVQNDEGVPEGRGS
jgi:hypothetical protein